MALSEAGVSKLTEFALGLYADLSKAEEVSDLFAVLSRRMNMHYNVDEQTMLYIKYGLMVMASFMVIVIVYGFYWLMADPVSAKYGKEAAGNKGGKKKSNKDKKSSKRQGNQHDESGSEAEASSASPASMSSPVTASTPAVMTRTRSRDVNVVEPSSTIKGFTRVGVLMTSPCQGHFLVSCRKSLKARRYPQSDKKEFMDRGKDLSEKAFTSLGDAIDDPKPDISVASFSSDGRYLALGNSKTDELMVFNCPHPSAHGKAGPLTPLWSHKPPKHGVVSTINNFSVIQHGEILSFHDTVKECGVKLVKKKSGGGSEELGTEQKVKIGRPTAVAFSDSYYVCGGSFLHECRLGYYDVRPDRHGFIIGKVFSPIVMPNRATKISKLALVSAGAPTFNTQDLMVMYCEDGHGYIYSIPWANRFTHDAELVGTFVEPDFANGNVDDMIVAVRGHEYHERLVIAFRHQGDTSVFLQTCDLWNQRSEKERNKADTKKVPTEIPHLCDFHDMHGEGNVVKKMCFVQNGRGLATSGEDGDGMSVRLWTLPE